jgi:hypothetical protein
MSLIPFSNLLIGAFSGITTYKCNLKNNQNQGQLFYKQEHLDYKILGAYYSIITPYQLIQLYSNLDVVTKIRLKGVKPYIHIPIAISMISIKNGGLFGIGYILGKVGYTTLYR